MKILVTGGAGYIGSHVVRQLVEAGHQVIVVDNLTTGHQWAVLDARLVECDLGDTDTLTRLFSQEHFDAVLHLAAVSLVQESVENPLKYYTNNVQGTLTLLEVMARFGVNRLVFSSSASVYGAPEAQLINEDCSLGPVNPYGTSKLIGEQMIRELSGLSGLNAVMLRYFNVAGADPSARIGEASKYSTHLVKIVCEAIVGVRKKLEIYGTDYSTPDGTCIRDYVHVEDIADAHVCALDYLMKDGTTVTLNCGYAQGYSVREVITLAQEVSGKALDIVESQRRPGDPPRLVADSQQIRKVLGWHPGYADLRTIITHALQWEVEWQRRLQ